MKTVRIINAAFLAVVAIALCIAVTLEWIKQGCPAKSVIIGCVYYLASSVTLCVVIDKTIQGK